MAATGVEWMPLLEALAARSLHWCLSSAQAMPRLPGRPRDVVDGPGRHTFHRSGFRAASLRPEAAVVALRTLWRQRAPLLAPRAPPLLPMHHALVPRPIPLSHALREVTGATAPKSARTVYHRRKNRRSYHDMGAAEYEQRFRERALRFLQKKAATLGYTLSPP